MKRALVKAMKRVLRDARLQLKKSMKEKTWLRRRWTRNTALFFISHGMVGTIQSVDLDVFPINYDSFMMFMCLCCLKDKNSKNY